MKMSKLKYVQLAVAAVMAGVAASAGAEMLTIQQYMDLVAKNNSQLISIQANIDAVRGKLAEIDRAYSYFLSAGANYSDDRSGRPYSLVTPINDISNFYPSDLTLASKQPFL